MSQPAVTEYFSKRRKRACVQPSKRLKVSDSANEVEGCKSKIETRNTFVKELREIKAETINAPVRRNKRTTTKRSCKSNTKKAPVNCKNNKDLFPVAPEENNLLDSGDLKLSITPSSSDTDSDTMIDVVTSCKDNHDEPPSPTKRSKSSSRQNPKRSRVTPRKNKAYNFDAAAFQSDTFQPNLEFPLKTRKTAKKKLTLVGNKNVEKNNNETVSSSKAFNNVSPNNKQITTSKPKEALKPVDTNEEKLSARELRKRNREKTNALVEKLMTKTKESNPVLKDSIKGASKLKDLQETLLKIREQKKKAQSEENIKKHKERMARRAKELEEKQKIADLKPDHAKEKREFAYEKLHSLAQETPKGLLLPLKYKNLLEMFKSTDTVVGMLFNRQQTTTWSILQKSVKDMARKNFEKMNLAQIKTVFPEAYLYRQEKGLISYEDSIKQSDYQLTIEPVLNTEECRVFGENPKKLTSNMLIRRRHHFNVQLLNIVKEQHKKFLSTLSPPMEVPQDQLKRWHPQFKLDQVLDISPSELPVSPLEVEGRCSSAKDVLEKARNKFTKKAVEALKKVAERVTPEKNKKRNFIMEENNNFTLAKDPATKPDTIVATPTKTVTSDPSLRGVSKSLLEKIRAKEADQKLRSMIRPDEAVEKIAQLKKLPDIARALRMLFITEKKAALPMELICDRLAKCSKGITSSIVVRELVELLSQEVPCWVSAAKVRNIDYIKMNRGREISEVLQEIDSRIIQAEKS